jgi:branched-chain amino acid transport system permease protein
MTGVVLQVGPSVLIETVIKGLGQAGLYVVLASGLTLIFGLMGVLNFAHGAFITIGTYLGAMWLFVFSSQTATGLGAFLPLVAVFVLVFVGLMALGSLVEFGLIRRLYGRPPIDQILLTFGVATVLQHLTEIAVNLFTEGTSNQAQTPWPKPESFGPQVFGSTVGFGDVAVDGLVVMEVILGAVVVVAVYAFLNRTRYGLYVRAGSDDDEMAEALGIDIRRVFTVVFGIGSGLAGVAGTFLVWEATYDVTISIGAQALLPAFIVVVVGGLGTFTGTVVAAAVAGFFFEFGVVLSTSVFEFVSLPQMLLFILLVVTLVVRPTGILGEEEVGGH